MATKSNPLGIVTKRVSQNAVISSIIRAKDGYIHCATARCCREGARTVVEGKCEAVVARNSKSIETGSRDPGGSLIDRSEVIN